jgi:hypothetical protein
MTHELSHSSILFVHHVVFANATVELSLGNVQLQDKRDWELIVESMDPSVAVDPFNGAHE